MTGPINYDCLDFLLDETLANSDSSNNPLDSLWEPDSQSFSRLLKIDAGVQAQAETRSVGTQTESESIIKVKHHNKRHCMILESHGDLQCEKCLSLPSRNGKIKSAKIWRRCLPCGEKVAVCRDHAYRTTTPHRDCFVDGKPFMFNSQTEFLAD